MTKIGNVAAECRALNLFRTTRLSSRAAERRKTLIRVHSVPDPLALCQCLRMPRLQTALGQGQAGWSPCGAIASMPQYRLRIGNRQGEAARTADRQREGKLSVPSIGPIERFRDEIHSYARMFPRFWVLPCHEFHSMNPEVMHWDADQGQTKVCLHVTTSDRCYLVSTGRRCESIVLSVPSVRFTSLCSHSRFPFTFCLDYM
jgi:hypothetical protein